MRPYQMAREASVDYVIDWGRAWLRGAQIVASRWSVDRPGEMLVAEQAAGDGHTRAMLSGGNAGVRYTVSSHVLLSDGRSGTRSLTLAAGGGR